MLKAFLNFCRKLGLFKEPATLPPTALDVTPVPAATLPPQPQLSGAKRPVGFSFTNALELISYLQSTRKGSRSWKYIVLHHSETDNINKKDCFDAIREYHIKHNGWSEIGYHLVLELVGDQPTVRLGRPLSTAGAHTVGMNHEAIGICVVGNFDHYKPEPALWNLELQIVRTLMQLYSIPKDKVVGHRETYSLLNKPIAKTCPGARFDLNAFRALL